MDSRACISNASMECGAKISAFPIDEITTKYLDENPRINNNIGGKIEIQPGTYAKYKDEFEIECDKIVPQVSGPDNVDKVHSVEELANVEIDQAFIGSSTNGRIEDLEIAARVLKGRKVHKNTRCVVTPASVKVYEDAIKRGYVEIYLEAGAVFTNATCGACVGTHLGVLGENENCISFFLQAEDGIRDIGVTGVQTCALPIYARGARSASTSRPRRSQMRFRGWRASARSGMSG